MKLTKKQLNTIKNAKTKDEAKEAYIEICAPAFEAYKEIKNQAEKAFSKWTEPKEVK